MGQVDGRRSAGRAMAECMLGTSTSRFLPWAQNSRGRGSTIENLDQDPRLAVAVPEVETTFRKLAGPQLAAGMLTGSLGEGQRIASDP